MPPAFALSQDQTLRFILRTGLNPSTYEPPCTHYSHRQLSQPPQTTRHQANHAQRHQTLKPNTRAPTAHPTPLSTQQPIATRHQKTAKSPQPLSPAPSHPSGQPRTYTSKTDATVKEQFRPTGRHPSQGSTLRSERTRLLSGPINLVTVRPFVNPPHQRREGASTGILRVCQMGFTRLRALQKTHGLRLGRFTARPAARMHGSPTGRSSGPSA